MANQESATLLELINAKINVDVDGNLKVAFSGTLNIDETNLATTAKQDTGNASLGSIDTKLTKLSDGTQKTQVVGTGGQSMPAGDVAARPIFVELSDGAAAIAPATAANQTTGNTALTALQTHQTDGTQKTQVIGPGGQVTPAGDIAARPVFVELSDGTNPVLPAAAAPADDEVNTTIVSAIKARLQGFDGTSWQRVRAGVTTVTNAFKGFLNALPWAIYNANPTARTEGQGGPLQADTTGNLLVSDGILSQKFGAYGAGGDATPNATAYGALHVQPRAYNGASWDRVRSGITAIGNTFTGFLNTLPTAIYHLAPSTRTDGQGGPFETDANGNLRVAEQNAPTYEYNNDAVAGTHDKPVASATFNAVPCASAAKSNTGCVKASPGNLYTLWVTNNHATASQAYALVNKAANPAGTDVGLYHFMVPPGQTLPISFRFGMRFSVGIAWAQVATLGATSITLAGSSDSTVFAEVG